MKKKIRKILSTTFILTFLVLGTTAIVMYARGYRFDHRQGTVEKTGVLDVKSDPMRNDLYINGKHIGKTPKTIPSLKVGKHQIELKREGYFDWKTEITITAEKSTPIHPILFISNPEQKIVWENEEKLVDKQITDRSNYIFFTTATENPSDESKTPLHQLVTHEYSLWRYNTNPSFWNASSNPIRFYTYQADGYISIDGTTQHNPTFEVLYTDNGERAILITRSAVNPETPEIIPATSILLLNTRTENSEPVRLQLETLSTSHKLSWAKDNQHIVLESDTEILSYNVSNGVTTILVLKDQSDTELAWSTDIDGTFYYTEELQPEDESTPPYMRINQILLNGQSQDIFVDKIYYSEKQDLLLLKDDVLERDKPFIFTNSPESSQFVGSINKFQIEKPIESVILYTEYAMYLLDLRTNKYSLVSASPSYNAKLSPNGERILFTTDSNLLIFNIKKEDADHITKLGTIRLLPAENMGLVRWHPSSRVIFYEQNENFSSVDVNGENNYEMADIEGGLYTTNQSGENLLWLRENEDGNTELVLQKIN